MLPSGRGRPVSCDKDTEPSPELGRWPCEARWLQLNLRCGLVVVALLIVTVLAVLYLPSKARYAIQYYKILVKPQIKRVNPVKAPTAHVLMGNKAGKTMANAVLQPGRIPETHSKCRNAVYPRTKPGLERAHVPDSKVRWTQPFPDYKPVNYTAPNILNEPRPVWADADWGDESYRKEHNSSLPKWNSLDGKIDRRSHMGNYSVPDGVPQNPVGRTGIYGRGCLGRWGPNHAADPIVTRWKRDPSGAPVVNASSLRPVLQFIAVQRRDNGQWALPGGMVDPGEKVSVTLKREFSEEAMNALDATPEEKQKIDENLQELFHTGKELYRGYVDDPRNTDNSWMETIAVNFHDGTGQSVGRFNLHAGDDAVGVRWTDIDSKLNLFASHSSFVQKAAEVHKAHW